MSRRLKYASITCLVALATLVSPAQALQFAPLTTPESAQVGELGVGAAGQVYLARQQDPAREVAIKVLRSASASAETLVPAPATLFFSRVPARLASVARNPDGCPRNPNQLGWRQTQPSRHVYAALACASVRSHLKHCFSKQDCLIRFFSRLHICRNGVRCGGWSHGRSRR